MSPVVPCVVCAVGSVMHDSFDGTCLIDRRRTAHRVSQPSPPLASAHDHEALRHRYKCGTHKITVLWDQKDAPACTTYIGPDWTVATIKHACAQQWLLDPRQLLYKPLTLDPIKYDTRVPFQFPHDHRVMAPYTHNGRTVTIGAGEPLADHFIIY